MTERPRRIIVGISGASGSIYGLRALAMLREAGVETHLVISNSGRLTMSYEVDCRSHDLADYTYRINDIGARISSGSFLTDGMLIAPCSVRTMAEIATGATSTLLTRAADVVLKERRRLVLVVRETPLHLGHLRTMAAVTEIGAIVMPPVPAFYAKPATIDDIVDHSVGRALDLFGIDTAHVRRWKDLDAQPTEPDP
jgi:4-hydroxy-3-polyprenylbenzoate decarboxylase